MTEAEARNLYRVLHQEYGRESLVAVSALDLDALRSVEDCEVQNGDDTDPRTYICTWQPQPLADALVALAHRVETAVLGGPPTCPHSFVMVLVSYEEQTDHNALFTCEKCGAPGMDTRRGTIVAVQILSARWAPPPKPVTVHKHPESAADSGTRVT